MLNKFFIRNMTNAKSKTDEIDLIGRNDQFSIYKHNQSYQYKNDKEPSISILIYKKLNEIIQVMNRVELHIGIH